MKLNTRRSNLCVLCRKRRRVYKYLGRWRRDKQHDLCRQCYRSQIDAVYQALNTQETSAEVDDFA